MRRRGFLYGLLGSGLGALVADRVGARAQGAAPSRLAEGRPSLTAQGTANLYFKNRTDGLRVNGLARLLKARR